MFTSIVPRPRRTRGTGSRRAPRTLTIHRRPVLEGLEDRCLLSNTVIPFDDLPAGTVLTNQYHSKGVDFIPPDLPVITAVGAGQANSGANVAIVRLPWVLSSTPSISRGSSRAPTSFVQVAVGEPVYTASESEQITLYAYDSSHNLVAQSNPASVTSGGGFRSIISVQSSSSNIASFDVSARPGYDAGKSLGIDDLTYDNPVVSQPDFTLFTTSTMPIELYTGRNVTDTISIQRINGSNGPIQFAVSGLPSGVTAGFSPSSTTSGNQINLVLTAAANATPVYGSTITVTATPSPTAGTISHLLHRFLDVRPLPQITSITPNVGSVPIALQPGTDLTIQGVGFDPQMLVEFGNQYAEVYPSSINGDETVMHVNVPRLATDGPLTLIAPYDGVTSSNPSLQFHVNSFRDIDGYAFPNYNDSGYTFADIQELFGYQQTHNANGTPAASAQAYLALWNSFPPGGQCYGISLSSERMVSGQKPYSNFPLQPGLTTQNVWDLNGPSGPSPTLQQYIHVEHMAQLSSEFEKALLQDQQSYSNGGAQAVYASVKHAFAQGEFPLLPCCSRSRTRTGRRVTRAMPSSVTTSRMTGPARGGSTLMSTTATFPSWPRRTRTRPCTRAGWATMTRPATTAAGFTSRPMATGLSRT